MDGPNVGLDRSSLHDLAHAKRFMELLEGDPVFRKEARLGSAARVRLLQAAGIELSEPDVRPFWDLVEARCGTDGTRERAVGELREHPLGRLWETWNQHAAERRRIAARECVSTSNPRLTAWRRRHLARARSEAFLDGDPGVSPLFAFELSKGCSTQCWFCAWDPPPLGDAFPYTPENRQLWRAVLSTAWELFGPGCRSAVCYHATEPTDNPDYFAFLRDVRELLGFHPHTTTARPLRDLAWTRELLRMQNEQPAAWDRFSVLTAASLREIHAVFSAEELLHVDLAFLNEGALTRKARSGRALKQEERLLAEEQLLPEARLPATLRQGTIECTCGYVVNMVDRRVQLISPCNASAQWPLGYIVHAERTFRDAAEFRAVILRSIEECMREHLEEGDRLAFREDLTYETRADGFVLTSRYRKHAATGEPHLALLGGLIRSGTLTTGEITERLIRGGMPPLDAISWLNRIHQGGLLAPLCRYEGQ